MPIKPFIAQRPKAVIELWAPVSALLQCKDLFRGRMLFKTQQRAEESAWGGQVCEVMMLCINREEFIIKPFPIYNYFFFSVWHFLHWYKGNALGLLWHSILPQNSPDIFFCIVTSFAPRLSLNIFGWQSSHLYISSCLPWGKTAGPTPAFFRLAALSSNTMSPSLAEWAIDSIAMLRKIANNNLSAIYFFAAFLGWVWHLLQSANGKATFPWHLPQNLPSTIADMVILFCPFAGTKMAGWHTSHFSHHVCI